MQTFPEIFGIQGERVSSNWGGGFRGMNFCEPAIKAGGALGAAPAPPPPKIQILQTAINLYVFHL